MGQTKRYVVTAFGPDRPGIVAGLTEALYDAGANLDDVSSTILADHFTMMLAVDVPAPPDDLEERLARAVASLGVSVTVREVGGGGAQAAPATHSLSVYGADRPGIVARFARLLADAGANVTDLSCRRVGEPGAEVYAMLAEVTLAAGADAEAIAGALATLGRDVGVDVTFSAVEADVL